MYNRAHNTCICLERQARMQVTSSWINFKPNLHVDIHTVWHVSNPDVMTIFEICLRRSVFSLAIFRNFPYKSDNIDKILTNDKGDLTILFVCTSLFIGQLSLLPEYYHTWTLYSPLMLILKNKNKDLIPTVLKRKKML